MVCGRLEGVLRLKTSPLGEERRRGGNAEFGRWRQRGSTPRGRARAAASERPPCDRVPDPAEERAW